jgi:predicted ATPase
MTTATPTTTEPTNSPIGEEHIEGLLSLTEDAVDFEKIESQRRLSKIIDADDAIATVVQEKDENDQTDSGQFTAVILELPKEDQEMLQVAACLGTTLDPTLLQVATSTDKHIVSSLTRWHECGIVRQSEEEGKYVFTDGAQQDAYELIPLNERCRFHASIGRNLVRNLTQEELQKSNAVLDQFSRGEDAISSQKERNIIAMLCLRAILWSVSVGDFRRASKHSGLGIRLLGHDRWREDYDLTLALYNASVEVMYAIDDYDRMDMMVSAVLENARSYRDTLRVRATRVLSLNSRYRFTEATDEGLDVLYHLGEKFPSRPRVHHFLIEFMRTQRLLRGKTNEMILRMPLMQNVDKIAAAQMLSLVISTAYYTNPIYGWSTRPQTCPADHEVWFDSSLQCRIC